jgi:hypothetical protein
MKRKGNPRDPLLSVGEVLRKWFNRKKLRVHLLDRSLLDGWERAVGPRIAGKARPYMVKERTLFVKVSSSVWMHQLQFLKGEILEKLNGLLGAGREMESLRFSIGTVEKKAPPPQAAVPLSDREREWIDAQVSLLRDEDLREILRKAMATSLMSRKDREAR